MAASLGRMMLQRQLELVRRGLFGTACRWLQLSSQNLSEEPKKPDSGNAESDSTSTESANENHSDDDDTAAFFDTEDQHTDVRKTILNAALEHVPEFGWSSEAIEAGAKTMGLSAMAEGMFPRGAGDLVLHFTEDCNVRLADHLVSQSRSAEKDLQESSGSPVRKSSRTIIRDAVEVRLRMLIPFIDQWPQAMGLMLLPQNAPDATKNVAYMVDEIWYHAGDTSTDINWYTKRGVLAGLYGSTELYMVSDRSLDFEETWSFLDRRMSDIGMLIGAKATLEKAGSDAAELLSAAFTTVRNMSGLNSRNR